MAIISKDYRVEIGHIGSSNFITNHGFLELLENVACYHSDTIKFGFNEISKTHLSWVLLHWKVKVLKRVRYGETVTVKTWAGYANRFFTMRDFEVYDKNGDLICIASSKWALVNTSTKGIAKITDDIIAPYKSEEKSVFNEKDIAKLKAPQTSSLPSFVFKVQRKDIDVNKHMHNICYLDYALEALPEDIYFSNEINEFEIMYKTGAKLGNEVHCYYTHEDDASFVVMKSADGTALHAIVKLIL